MITPTAPGTEPGHAGQKAAESLPLVDTETVGLDERKTLTVRMQLTVRLVHGQ